MLNKLKKLAGNSSATPMVTLSAKQPVSLPASKIGLVITMLERSEGATLTDLCEATGWLPHTTRAALTRLRQKGNSISKTRRDGVSVYAVAKAA